MDSSSLLGVWGQDNNEFLSSTQDTKTTNQTDDINGNKFATELHGFSSVEKEGK